MAEGFARALAPQVSAASAGIEAEAGSPASDGATLAMQDVGIDISDHRSRTIAQALGAGAEAPDLIFALEPIHAAAILRRHPSLAGRVHLLRTDGKGVADPHTGNGDDYERARDEIRDAVAARATQW